MKSLFFLCCVLPLLVEAKCEMPIVEYPPDASWKITDRHVYEDSWLGSSLSVRTPEGKGSLYVYSLGIQNPEQGDLKEQIDQGIRDIKRSVAQRGGRGTESFGLPDSLYSHISFISETVYLITEIGSGTQMEFISIGTLGGCFHKIRYTSLLPSMEKADLTQGVMSFSRFINGINFQYIDRGYVQP